MTPKRQAILFDMDGVTLDTEPLYQKAEIRLFKEYGVNIPKEDWKLFPGCSEKTFYDLSMARYDIKEERGKFISKGRDFVLQEFDRSLDFMPGFLNLHSNIKSRYKMGLVTASPTVMVRWINQRININYYFNEIITAEDTENTKPHPEPYLAMMEKLAVQSDDAIVIEDSVHGINAGIAAGAFVIAKTGSVPLSELQKAHKIIHHLNELTPNVLEECLQG